MKDNLVQITQYDGPGYRPLVDFEGWRVAILNDDPTLYRRQTVKTLERHNCTDEVFVLLQGKCTLCIGQGQTPERIEGLEMEPLKLYNVRKSVWHNLIASPDMVLLIVENPDTGPANTDYAPVTEDMLP